MSYQRTISFQTHGRGTWPITEEVAAVVAESEVNSGLCHIFIKHTSASVILCENADPTVRSDVETILTRLAPDGDPSYQHTLEGPDDMSAHVRSVLTSVDLTLPISGGHLALGTWQGIYLYEHRTHPHNRSVVITVRS
jgi:secondary thiamine-phosphate synthase enzyme